MIFSLERMNEICYNSSVFLIRLIPTHDNSLQVNLKVSIFEFAYSIPLAYCSTCNTFFKNKTYILHGLTGFLLFVSHLSL